MFTRFMLRLHAADRVEPNVQADWTIGRTNGRIAGTRPYATCQSQLNLKINRYVPNTLHE